MFYSHIYWRTGRLGVLGQWITNGYNINRITQTHTPKEKPIFVGSPFSNSKLDIRCSMVNRSMVEWLNGE